MKANPSNRAVTREERAAALFRELGYLATAGKNHPHDLDQHLIELRALYDQLEELGAERTKPALAANPGRAEWYVFEMQVAAPGVPVRVVNQRPLTLDQALALARIGAEKGKLPRTVTRDPRSKRYQPPDIWYEPGTGRKIPF